MLLIFKYYDLVRKEDEQWYAEQVSDTTMSNMAVF